jgi:hypothetical protein
MTASRSIITAFALACAVAIGAIGAPTPVRAALKPKPGVTPEQLGVCLGTVQV